VTQGSLCFKDPAIHT